MITSRFCWPCMRRDTAKFVRNCIQCQRSKIQRHIRSKPAKYEPPKERFTHINIDVVGPFPSCEGQRYCLTVIDRFTRWPEAIPIPEMSAETIVKALLTQWISRFGVPAKITSDRGRQFESAIFAELIRTIGATHFRTTSYHPESNGIIERWHRTLKAAILCHDPARWVYYLPAILLGLRVAYKPDLKASPAEMVYGTTLTVPGEFFQQSIPPVSSSDFVSEFRATMQQLQPTDTAHHSTPRTFISKSLQSSTHVFVRNDSVKPSLSHPYDGPYEVLKRTSKFFTISIKGRQSNISIDRLKPAFMATSDTTNTPSLQIPDSTSESNSHLQTVPNVQPSCIDKTNTTSVNKESTPILHQHKQTRGGRQIRLPLRFR